MTTIRFHQKVTLQNRYSVRPISNASKVIRRRHRPLLPHNSILPVMVAGRTDVVLRIDTFLRHLHRALRAVFAGTSLNNRQEVQQEAQDVKGED